MSRSCGTRKGTRLHYDLKYADEITFKSCPIWNAADENGVPGESEPMATMKSQSVAPKPVRAKSGGSEASKAFGNMQKTIAIQKILVPTDFSPASRKAFSYALRFAKDLNSEITLLHVLEPEVPLTLAGRPAAAAFSEEELADAEESLRALIDSAKTTGVAGTRSVLRTGVATHEIVEAAKNLDVDLIVIATHGFTGRKHFAIGSTAERVARAAPCPVLVVREIEHDFI
jgi:universal stress protein A